MLLALDTSTQMVGMGLYDGAQIIGEMVWKTQNHHTVEIAPSINELLSRCGVRPTDLEVIAVALGPGSFTSLRIGLAVAKGMALALRIPIVGIPSLDILAAAQPLREFPLAAVLQSGRGRLAIGYYKTGKTGWESQGELEIRNIDSFSEEIQSTTIVCGELTAAERQILARKRRAVILASPALSLRRPSYLGELAWKRWRAGKVDEVISLAPIYLSTSETPNP